jgi:hypothetical protein
LPGTTVAEPTPFTVGRPTGLNRPIVFRRTSLQPKGDAAAAIPGHFLAPPTPYGAHRLRAWVGGSAPQWAGATAARLHFASRAAPSSGLTGMVSGPSAGTPKKVAMSTATSVLELNAMWMLSKPGSMNAVCG